MPIEKPTRRILPVKAGGIWDEATTPSIVGGSGLTTCSNLVYRRYGAWSKRSGSAPAYQGIIPVTQFQQLNNALASGIRWYRAYPAPFTQTVVASQTALFTGASPNLTPPYGTMTQIATFAQAVTTPPCFASMRDPAESSVAGNPAYDVLVICGASLPNIGYQTAQITLSGTPLVGQILAVAFSGTGSGSYSYTTIQGDTLATAAAGLVAAINAGVGPFLAPAVTNAAGTIITLTPSGTGLSGIGFVPSNTTPGITLANVGAFTVPPTLSTFSGPLKYDGTNLTPLSSQIRNPFTGCVAWHNHMWFWGDPAHPDTVYASDISNPEGFTFMTQYGGYDIAVGDGDPMVQACVPIGNNLYVFKRNSIYVITGFDFQSGEYQFAVQPVIKGYGIPARQCVAQLRNTLVFWSGSGFYRLANGSFDPEYIGSPIPITSRKIALGDQDLIRCVAGSFTLSTMFGAEIRTNVALWAVDVGSGIPDTVLVYDDDASSTVTASSLTTTYAWSVWKGWTVAAWIPFGGGGGPTSVNISSGVYAQANSYGLGDAAALYFIPFLQAQYYTLNQVGGNAGADIFTTGIASLTQPVANPISFAAQTGWITADTPILRKRLHQLFLQLEASVPTQAVFTLAVTTTIGTAPGTATTMSEPGETFQNLRARINPSLRGNAYQLMISESGTNTGYEITGVTYDFIEEALDT